MWSRGIPEAKDSGRARSMWGGKFGLENLCDPLELGAGWRRKLQKMFNVGY